MCASLQKADEALCLFCVSGLTEDALIHCKVGHVDDRIGREHDCAVVSLHGECLALCVGPNGLYGVFERQLGEAALTGLELVACGIEQIHPPGRLRSEYEAQAFQGPKKRPSSRSALSGESEPWTRLSGMLRARSPRIVPGAASAGLVAPIRVLMAFIAPSPLILIATTGVAVMNSTSSSKKGFSRCSA